MRRHLRALAMLLGLAATSAMGSVDEIRLHVKGLACPFCVFGIEKSLKQLPGVVSLETTIRTGVIGIKVKPGAPLDPARLQEAVVKSGFTLDHIEATVTGKLMTRDGRPALEATPGGQVFLLLEGGAAGPLQLPAPETLDKLKQASADGSRPLTISGRVHGHADMPPALAVEAFEATR